MHPRPPLPRRSIPTAPLWSWTPQWAASPASFYQQQAPKAVANFIGLAEGAIDWTDPANKKKQHHKPFYDNTTFHRVIPEFMIQGGDPTGTGMGDPGFSFNDEFDPT